MPIPKMRMNFGMDGSYQRNYGFVQTPKAQTPVQVKASAPVRTGNGFNSMFNRLNINTAGGGGCGCGK